MIGNKKILGLIPARGGSKRIPSKNLQKINNSSLLDITISQALASALIDKVIVSSENLAILHAAEMAGATILKRPESLAQDDTPGIDPVLHVLKAMPDFDYVVLLQVTSPFRTTEDIDATIRHCIENQASACVSVCRPEHHPAWMFNISSSGRLKPLMQGDIPSRSQDLPECYVLNGAVYVGERTKLIAKRSFISEETISYEMPADRSLDIDTELDLEIAKALWKS